MLVLQPSPEELVRMLVDDELVALDLLLERLPSQDADRRRDFNEAAEVPGLDPKDVAELVRIVPDPERRGAVITIARQLRQVGISIRPGAEAR